MFTGGTRVVPSHHLLSHVRNTLAPALGSPILKGSDAAIASRAHRDAAPERKPARAAAAVSPCAQVCQRGLHPWQARSRRAILRPTTRSPSVASAGQSSTCVVIARWRSISWACRGSSSSTYDRSVLRVATDLAQGAKRPEDLPRRWQLADMVHDTCMNRISS